MVLSSTVKDRVTHLDFLHQCHHLYLLLAHTHVLHMQDIELIHNKNMSRTEGTRAHFL